MTPSTDVAVVGGGVVGLGAAHALARRGVRTLVFERRAVGHDRGSSHGPSRITRLAYHAADYIALARRSFALWHELAEASGEELVVPCGGIDFGPPDAMYLSEMRAAMRAAGVPFSELDREAIVACSPQLRPPEGAVGIYQPDYAMLAADRCLAVLAARARAGGAEIREGERVSAVEVDGDGVEVVTETGRYRASRVVLAAGSWLGPLLAPLGIELPLTVLREQLAFFEPRDEAAFAPGAFPLFVHRFPGTTTLGSGFPLYGEPRGVKLMLDRLGPAAEPESDDRSIDADLLARLRAYAGELLPGLTGEVVAAVSCRYTMTPDEDFVVDVHPAHPQVVIASACSGHGFKFAIVVGEVLADLALDGGTSEPIERFRIDRPALRAATTWRR